MTLQEAKKINDLPLEKKIKLRAQSKCRYAFTMSPIEIKAHFIILTAEKIRRPQ